MFFSKFYSHFIYVKANQTKREELNSISNKIYLFVTAPSYSPGFDFNTLPVLKSSAALFAASKRSSSFL